MPESRCKYVSGDRTLAVAAATVRVRSYQPVRPKVLDLDGLDVRRLMDYDRRAQTTAPRWVEYSAPFGIEAPSVARGPRMSEYPVRTNLQSVEVELWAARIMSRRYTGLTRQKLRSRIERLEAVVRMLSGPEMRPDEPEPSGCLPTAPTDTLAHGRVEATCGHGIEASRCYCAQVPSRYARYRAAGDDRWTTFDRLTGERRMRPEPEVPKATFTF